MPAPFDDFLSLNFVQVLERLTQSRKTGYLLICHGEERGRVVFENGVILDANTPSCTGLLALFQFVGWRDAQFEFRERPMVLSQSRDLAAYESQVLISGVAFKHDEMSLLQEALPDLEAVPLYTAEKKPASFETNASDLGLLSLADGRRTVREIADRVRLSPTEVARHLARFRLAGVVKLLKVKLTPRMRTAMAALV